jgi:hypothetical protein
LSKRSQKEPKEKITFLEDDDEKHIGISMKGKFETNQQNDQTIKSLLKKPKKKSREKCPITQRVSILTKTRAAKVHRKSK